MSPLKTSLLTLATAAAVFGSTAAAAASFEVWNGTGWTNNGATHLTGTVSLLYVGTNYPCKVDWTVTIVGGVATVTNAAYSGTAACAAMAPQHLPWPIAAPTVFTGPNPPFAGAPVLTAPLYNVKISGYQTLVPPPVNMACPSPATTGTIPGVLDASNRFTFYATLGPCTMKPNPLIAPNSLVADPALRVAP